MGREGWLVLAIFAVAPLASTSAGAQGWVGALGGLGEAMSREADHQRAIEEQERAFVRQKQLIEFQMRLEEERQRGAEARRTQQAERARQAALARQAQEQQAAEQARQTAAAQRAERERAQEQAIAAEQRSQLETLTAIHPDWRAIRQTQAFERWVQRNLSVEEVERFSNSWDAGYVASVFSRYKQSRKKQ